MIMTQTKIEYCKKAIIESKKTYLMVDKKSKFGRKVRNTFAKKELEDHYLFFLNSNGDLIKVTFENELFFFEEYREGKIANYSYFRFDQAKMAIEQKLAK